MFPLLVIVGCLAFIILLFTPEIASYLEKAWQRVDDDLEQRCQESENHARKVTDSYEEIRRMKHFMAYLDELLDDDRAPAPSLDRNWLKARKQALKIRRIIQKEIPDAVQICFSTHRLAALARGVTYIYEVADTPECYATRERVIGLSEACQQQVANFIYLARDPALIHNSAVLGGVLQVCRHCPYLEHRLDRAPDRCRTAEIFDVKPPLPEPEKEQDENEK